METSGAQDVMYTDQDVARGLHIAEIAQNIPVVCRYCDP